MMRSMFSAVSGLRVHQTKMDVIANNISNVNTNGYKASRATFAEIFAQTTVGASRANEELQRGGVNPMQIGLGSTVASIDVLMTQGAAQRTDNPFDVMIQGEGFFMVSDSGGTFYTRAGAFRQDNFGYISNPNGYILNGWRANESVSEPGKYKVDKGTNPQQIQITSDDEYIKPQVTSNIEYTGNLNARDTNDAGEIIKDTSIRFYDSLGNNYKIDIRYQFDTNAGQWNVQLGNFAYLNGDTKNPYTFTAAAGGDVNDTISGAGSSPFGITLEGFTPVTTETLTYTDTGAILAFGTNGLVDPTSGNTSLQFNIDVLDIVPNADMNIPITVNMQKMTQFEKSSDATSTTLNGNAAGTLNGLSVGPDGTVTGRYSNGMTKPLWQIALAQFKNAAGLERIGNNLYAESINSGSARIVEAKEGTTLIPGTLEMANVDLAAEFTEMITTQRGFQANSRVITTSDDMLQELVNLKR